MADSMIYSGLLDTPLSRVMFYRRTCGLPAVIDPPEHGRIVLRARKVWWLTMPTEMGQTVMARMQSQDKTLGPIVSHPRADRWSILIRPDLGDDDTKLIADMYRSEVSIGRDGAQIVLPSPSSSPMATRYWIVAPRNTFRPSGQMVAEVVRALAEQAAARHGHSGTVRHVG